MSPTTEWLAQWEEQRHKLKSFCDLNAYFTETEIAGKQLAIMNIGPCSIPTGHVLVRDPLAYLIDRINEPYFQTAPTGTFTAEVCVVAPDEFDCARYAAVRLRFSDDQAVRFEEALIGNENIVELEEDQFFGFNVDAGLCSICDKEVHLAYCDFNEQWNKDNPGLNIYNEYFAPLFAESYKQHPEYQRDSGDWINWNIPNTDYHLPMFQSGFGDGAYPVYWGFNDKGDICQLVVQFIDIALAYSEDDEEDENLD